MTSSPPCRRGPRRPAACSTRCWACSSPAPRSCSGSSPLPGRLAPPPSRADTMDTIDTIHDRETIRDGVRCQCVREASKMSNVDPNMTLLWLCNFRASRFFPFNYISPHWQCDVHLGAHSLSPVLRLHVEVLHVDLLPFPGGVGDVVQSEANQTLVTVLGNKTVKEFLITKAIFL